LKTKLILIFTRALVELQRRGILKCLVSQNCDGLHLRSGMNSAHLAELHGNMNLETCKKCKARYLRDFDTDMDHDDHTTGRRCDKPACRGKLMDSLIHFGENLPEDELNKAFDHAEKADVCLVLGKIISFARLSSC
jgi:NAD-dependent SIR2 family protein deacetylase